MTDETNAHNLAMLPALKALVEPAIAARGNDASIMVAIESLVLGGILFNERAFGVSRAVSAERLEAMVERIHERLGTMR